MPLVGYRQFPTAARTTTNIPTRSISYAPFPTATPTDTGTAPTPTPPKIVPISKPPEVSSDRYTGYVVMGTHYYGVTASGTMEKLNLATPGSRPDPRYQVWGPGINARDELGNISGVTSRTGLEISFGDAPSINYRSELFGTLSAGYGEHATIAAPTGRTKSEIMAFATARATQLKEQYFRGVPIGVPWSQLQRATEFPSISLLSWAIYKSQLPVIISTYGSGGGSQISSPSPASQSSGISLVDLQIATMTTPFKDSSGAINVNVPGAEFLENLLGYGYSQDRQGDAQLIESVQRQIDAIGSLFKPITEPVWDFLREETVIGSTYKAGMFVGLDIELTEMYKQSNIEVEQYEKKWAPMISKGVFTGTETQYAAAQEEYNKISATMNKIESMEMQKEGLRQDIFGTQPAKEELWTYPAVRFLEGVAGEWQKGIDTSWKPFMRPLTGSPVAQYTERTIEAWRPLALMAGPAGAILSAKNPLVISTPSQLEEAATAIASAPGGFIGMVGMIVGGGEVIVRHPEAILPAAVLGGYLQARSIYEGMTTRPLGFFYENVAYAAMTEGAIAGMKWVSPLDIGMVDVPTGKTIRSYNPITGKSVSIPQMTTIAGVYAKNPFAGMIFKPGKLLHLQNPFEFFNWVGTRPVMGYIGGKGIFFGSPVKKFGTTPIGSGYLPFSRSEAVFTRPIMASRLAKNPVMLNKYIADLGAVEMAMRGYTDVAPIRAWGERKPEMLAWDTWNRVVDYINRNAGDIVPYGSTTQSVFLEKTRVTLGDIDLDIRPSVAEVHAKAIYEIIRFDKNLRDLGPLVKESSQLTEGRWTARSPSKGIILDLHPFWKAEWEIPGAIPVSEGMKIMPLSETVGGKIFFSSNYRETVAGLEAIIEYGEGRFKDPADLAIIFGNLARIEAQRGLRWDVNRIRVGMREARAQRFLDIATAYEQYVREFVGPQEPRAIQYMQEAGWPARGVDVRMGPLARWDIRIGAITEVIDGRVRLGEAPPRRQYGFSLNEYYRALGKPVTTEPSHVFLFPSIKQIGYPSLFSPEFARSPLYRAGTLSPEYRATLSPSLYLDGYSGRVEYPTYGDYPTVGKYPSLPTYPGEFRYPSLPVYPTQPKYLKPSIYPQRGVIPEYPARPIQPIYPPKGIVPTYPGTVPAPQYPTTVKAERYLSAIAAAYGPIGSAYKPPTEIARMLRTTPIVYRWPLERPIIRRRSIWIEEKKQQFPRVKFFAHRWWIRNPVPTIPYIFGTPNKAANVRLKEMKQPKLPKIKFPKVRLP